MIELKLTADTAEELRNQLITLIEVSGASQRQPYPGSDRVAVMQESTNNTEEGNAIVKQLLEEQKATPDKPKTRSRAAVQPKEPDADIPSTTVPDPALTTPDPDIPAPTQTTIAPTDDLLGSSPAAPANLLDTPVASKVHPLANVAPNRDITKPVQDGAPTLEQLKHKIASNNNKQAIRDLIKSGYTKADGTPCYGPSDVQKKDYTDLWAKLDML